MNTITIQINIGLSNDLRDMLQELLPVLTTKKAETKTAESEPKTPKSVPEVKKNEPKSPESAPAAPQKEYTEEDVRAAMDSARKRIEGENYKEQTDSEGYKKYHRLLTTWFKETAKMWGSDKPSALPDSEARSKFIACCAAVMLNDAGELDSDLPNFEA